MYVTENDISQNRLSELNALLKPILKRQNEIRVSPNKQNQARNSKTKL
jgi:hypothetical protein